ncbi:hypothetical protein [Bradyrhizobium sp. JYMT SZCCT0428]|uniref:hypothetical protein n=1 Tax=Bradyrhizobium sp. JYMT SZCCT0428 TaxID=2807673 RepID=UPI001BACA0DE|nr:hypothetical protein [Bradyrhizobium sp. JYMT SZCCT0428]MBR1149347.1 hypothetical protein [Bradyrhizobium sp. JYMT SZCCT0428]
MTSAIATQRDEDREFTLQRIRVAISRVRLIAEELVEIGMALKTDRISSSDAVEWAAYVAPGCLDTVADTMEVGQ